MKNNYKESFEQIKVGPGLNQNYNDPPAGGFHPLNDRQFKLPKSVDC